MSQEQDDSKKSPSLITTPKSQTEKEQRVFQFLKKQEEFFDHLVKVGRFPHAGQKPIFKRLRDPRLKNVFLQCSRNFGKSTLSAQDMIFDAGCFQYRKNYIIAPFRVLAAEIYYHSGEVDMMIPPSWRLPGDEGFNKTELRWRLKTGSYLKIDGADNEAAVRGYKPTRLVCDEFQDWKTEVYRAMEPNLVPHDATVIKIGTPPKEENIYTVESEHVRLLEMTAPAKNFYAKRTIYDNPLWPIGKIEELRDKLFRNHEEIVWKREYLAEFVPGGEGQIFTVFSRSEHVRPREWIEAQIALIPRGHRSELTISDPSGTRHATVFMVLDRANACIYITDCILETNSRKLSCGLLKPRILQKEENWFINASPWRVYDEAAKLFAIEMENLGMIYTPTSKRQNDKSNNISLARDLMVQGRFFVNETDAWPVVEDIERYRYNEKGRIVKAKDDCVDCVLYGLAEAGVSLNLSVVNPNTPDRSRNIRPKETGIKEDLDGLVNPSHPIDIDFETEEIIWQ